MKEEKQKIISITIGDITHELAKKQSKTILGRQNVSLLFTHFINEQKKRDAETPR